MDHVLHRLPDGISFVSRSPNDPNPPPTPAGTYVTVNNLDSAGRPYLTVFIPPITHPETVNDLNSQLENLQLNEQPRLLPPGSRLCIICSRLGSWIASAVQEKRWPPFESSLTTVASDSVWLSNVFTMGYLDDILKSPACALCRLVGKARENLYLPSEFYAPIPKTGQWKNASGTSQRSL